MHFLYPLQHSKIQIVVWNLNDFLESGYIATQKEIEIKRNNKNKEGFKIERALQMGNRQTYRKRKRFKRDNKIKREVVIKDIDTDTLFLFKLFVDRIQKEINKNGEGPKQKETEFRNL